jgi:hypothetical protein
VVNIITTTLASGQILSIEPTATFGDVMITGLALVCAAALALGLVFKVVYR